MDTEPLERLSLVDRLTTKLREEILSGRYDKGETLPPERMLAQSLRVNRTSLKHALMRLEQLGFISTKHGIGSVVLDPIESAGSQLLTHWVFRSTGIDAEVLSDLIEARTLMGGFLARLSAERRSEGDLARMREALSELAQAPDDPDRVQELELAFHRAMLRGTKNKVFALIASSVFAIYGGRAGVFRTAFADKKKIRDGLGQVLEAIEKKDAVAAEAAALRYLRANGRALVEAAKASDASEKE